MLGGTLESNMSAFPSHAIPVRFFAISAALFHVSTPDVFGGLSNSTINSYTTAVYMPPCLQNHYSDLLQGKQGRQLKLLQASLSWQQWDLMWINILCDVFVAERLD